MSAGLWVTLGILAAAGLVWFGLPQAMAWRERRRLRRRCRGTLVLTYDDGPGPILTKRLLEVLARQRARATFFLVGERAEAHPEVVDCLREAGHELGAHTHAHLHAWRAWPWSAARDMTRGYETLGRWLTPAAMFRPAFGKLTLVTWRAVRRRGACLGWWTHDGGDTHARLGDPQRVLRRIRRDGGGVVLLHDFDRGPERGAYVLALTRLLLEEARRERWRVRTLGQVLAEQPAPHRRAAPVLVGREDRG
ncbi:MAG: polysaccharide deacetylase family protein [Planctomycetota bacterium]|jgi:peptidoglycan/xylan/chitin deacetylase (PgdA/CDA1 family)